MAEIPIEEIRADLKVAGIDLEGPKVVGKLLRQLATVVAARDMAFAAEKKSYIERYKVETERDGLKAENTRLIALCRNLGPEHPGHTCGPQSNCDAGCYAHAEFEKLLRATKENE